MSEILEPKIEVPVIASILPPIKAPPIPKSKHKPKPNPIETVATPQFEIKAVADQKSWEKRPYMRLSGESLETVCHTSAYGVNEARDASLTYMQKCFADTGKTEFIFSDIIQGIHSFGPAHGDSVRNGVGKLKDEGLVKVSPIKSGRAHYKVELIVAPPTPEPIPNA